MKIIIPEDISEITLDQYLKYEELQARNLDSYNFNKRKFCLFTGVSVKLFNDNIPEKEFIRVLNLIDEALAKEPTFMPTFKMYDIEFGFIPNLDKITIGEYADLVTHGVDKESMHRLMAVLFRPVVNRKGDAYEIMKYNGSEEYAEMMKGMPMHCVNGALVFFYNLANELQTATQKYLTEELQREMMPPTSSLISGGIQRLRNWLRTTSLTYQR